MIASAGTTLDGARERASAHARLTVRALLSRTAALVALQLVGYGAFLLFQLSAARLLGASGYGALAHALAMGTFVALLGMFGSDRILVRELLSRADPGSRAQFGHAFIQTGWYGLLDALQQVTEKDR